MTDKEIELAWKAVHGELSASEREGYLLGLDSNELARTRFDAIQAFDQRLMSVAVPDEEWLDGLTSRILDEMDRDESQGSAGSRQRRLPQVAMFVAAVVVALFSFNVWMNAPDLRWDNPKVVQAEYRTQGSAERAIEEHTLQLWHKAFQSEIDDQYKGLKSSSRGSWTLAVSYQEVDEGLRVDVSAESSNLQEPVRSWTFFASDLEKLQVSAKTWAEEVVRGIVAKDP